MALTADRNRQRTQPVGLIAPSITPAVTIFAGGLVGGGSRDHTTANRRGRAFMWSKSAGEIPLGWALNGKLDDGTDIGPGGEIETASEAQTVDELVTGLAGDVTDVFRLVYATDDNTFTLTRAAPDIPVGIIVRFIDTASARVRFFSFVEMAIISMGGGNRVMWHLGTVRGGATAGNSHTGIVSPYSGRITDVYGIVTNSILDADADLDINLEIGGVNVTGGVIEWLTADVQGAKKSGTAITALNKISDGDLIDIEVVVNTASTADDPGTMDIYADILLEPGL